MLLPRQLLPKWHPNAKSLQDLWTGHYSANRMHATRLWIGEGLAIEMQSMIHWQLISHTYEVHAKARLCETMNQRNGATVDDIAARISHHHGKPFKDENRHLSSRTITACIGRAYQLPHGSPTTSKVIMWQKAVHTETSWLKDLGSRTCWPKPPLQTSKPAPLGILGWQPRSP